METQEEKIERFENGLVSEFEKEELKISFEESLSDSSIELIKKVLKESLRFDTKIERIN